ncbi:sterol-binding protein [Pseudoduganella eburnea]|uniref:Ubiquinone biosynthesis accessory factor UbiT n=2 Tax=Massilia eburnea TaxID=1776165 RepID=A0A6L6QKE2_9BURK|nr:sterol-binding protein [Massilia eburnea]
MSTAQYRIPSAIGRLLGRLPPQPPAWLFVQGLNRILAPQLPDDVKQALFARRLRLRVEDAGLAIDFSWQGKAFEMARHGDQPDLTIGACAHDLVLMARRQEDPDTLFFSRRLILEGDTELGLLFKNTLDGLDASVFDWRQLLPKIPTPRVSRPGSTE